MSEVFAPRYLAGLVSTHRWLRNRHLCQTPLNRGGIYPCVLAPRTENAISEYSYKYRAGCLAWFGPLSLNTEVDSFAG